jgi:hypothetical protein
MRLVRIAFVASAVFGAISIGAGAQAALDRPERAEAANASRAFSAKAAPVGVVLAQAEPMSRYRPFRRPERHSEEADPNEYGGNLRPAEDIPIVPVGHGGFLANGPNCGSLSQLGGNESLWLGHFSGGAGGREQGQLAWRDLYACFPSRRGCDAWQRDMKASLSEISGYRSCQVVR